MPGVWIFMGDGRSVEDNRDLDHLPGLLWGANRHTRKGDIVLLYRTTPYRDIAYLFRAAQNARPTRPKDNADWPYVVELAEKVRLDRQLTLAHLRKTPSLKRWSFVRYQQGVMRRERDIRAEGVWPALRELLIARGDSVLPALRSWGDDVLVHHRSRGGRIGPSRRLRVFLSYASEDRRRVASIAKRLKKIRWIELWFDRDSIPAGKSWRDAIRAGITLSHAIVICLSRTAVTKRGFFQNEVTWALEAADEQPAGTTVILPAKLDNCRVPKRLSRAQWVDLFERDGQAILLRGLKHQAQAVLPRQRRTLRS